MVAMADLAVPLAPTANFEGGILGMAKEVVSTILVGNQRQPNLSNLNHFDRQSKHCRFSFPLDLTFDVSTMYLPEI